MRQPDYFNKKAAEQLKIDVALVKKVNSYFWRKGVKSNLSNANYRAIFIKNFGTITISRYKLNREIQEIIAKIKSFRINQRLTAEKKQTIDFNLRTILKQLLVRRNEIAQELYNNNV